MTLSVAISGATGRMGHELLTAIHGADDLTLAAALTNSNDPAIGKDPLSVFGQSSGLVISASVESLANARVLIDFSRPQGTLTYLPYCQAHHISMVIGTTGFSAEERQTIEQAAKDIPIVLAANMSTGVNVLIALLKKAAQLLPQYDCEIVEMHHRHKADAPSGTALELGRAVAQAREQNFDDVATFARVGFTGERKAGTIGFAALRGGDVVGDHTVIFAGTGERIELSHKASSRQAFAQGALTAARFVSKRKNGLYSMNDVLGIH